MSKREGRVEVKETDRVRGIRERQRETVLMIRENQEMRLHFY